MYEKRKIKRKITLRTYKGHNRKIKYMSLSDIQGKISIQFN